jgi:hypothetical protein
MRILLAVVLYKGERTTNVGVHDGKLGYFVGQRSLIEIGVKN